MDNGPVASPVCKRRRIDNASESVPKRTVTLGSVLNEAGTSQTKVRTREGLERTLHGIAYQARLYLIIMLHAARALKEDAAFEFSITREDPRGGKFDDIGFRCKDEGGRWGTLFVQAKHKISETKTTITWKDLLSASKDAPFAIAKYFNSFLDHRWESARQPGDLILCTNVALADDVSDSVTKHSFSASIVGAIFDSIGGQVFKIDLGKLKEHRKSDELFQHLHKSSNFVSLAKELADHIFNEKVLDLNNRLFKKYRYAIESHIATSVPLPKDGKCYKINELFLNRSNDTPFKVAFHDEYKSLAASHDNICKDIRSKGIWLTDGFYSNDTRTVDATDLPKPIASNQMERFFDSFAIVCNTDSEGKITEKIIQMLAGGSTNVLPEQMKGFIEPELAEGMLSNRVFEWIKDRRGRPLQRKDVDDFFKYFVATLHYLQLKGVSNKYCTEMEHTELQFKRDRLAGTRLFQELEAWQSQTVSTIDLRQYDAHPLVVWQVLKLFEHPYIFVDGSTLEAMKSTARDVLCAMNFRFLLVIDCKDERKNWNDLLAHHNGLRDCPKRILVLRVGDGALMRDLTDESRARFCEQHKHLPFFGTNIPLEKILDEGDSLRFLFEVTGKSGTLQARENLIATGYERIKPMYIQRKWQSCDAVKGEQSSENFWKWRNRNVLSNMKNLDALLARPDTKVCITQLVEVMNHGRPTKRSIYAEDQKRIVPPGSGDKNTTKVHIFLNDAGLGKTLYFTWLAWDLQVAHPSWWIIKFNLIEYSTDFNRLSVTSGQPVIDEPRALRILFQLMYLAFFAPNINRKATYETDRQRTEAKECADMLALSEGRVLLDDKTLGWHRLTTEQVLLLRVFREKFNAKELVILFDGFDEITPFYKDVGLALLSSLANLDGIVKIYLSSRPYDLREDFEEAVPGSKYIRLKTLWRDDKKKFLHRNLLNNFDKYETYDGKVRNAMMRLLTKLTDDLLGDLSCVPLFLAMAFETFASMVKEHMDQDACTISPQILKESEQMFELLRMMETFIDKKLSIANTEKTGSTSAGADTVAARVDAEEKLKRTKWVHSLLALYLILTEDERAAMLSQDEQHNALDYMQKVDDGLEKSGIVDGVVDNVPMFIHRLFAEYFAAHWLFCNRDRAVVRDYLKRSLYENDDRKEVRQFIDRMVCRDNPLHMAVLDGSRVNVENILTHAPTLAEETDDWGRTPLHLTVLYFRDHYGAKKVLDVLLQGKNAAYIDTKDALLQRSATDYAFALGKGDYVKHRLLENGASVDTDALFQRLLSKDPVATLCNAGAFENELMSLTEWCLSQTKANSLFDKVAERFTVDNNINLYTVIPMARVPQPMPRALALKLKRLGKENHNPGQLTLLQFLAILDSAALLRNLVRRAGERKLKQHSDGLVKVALEYCSVHVLQYLIIECKFQLPKQITFKQLMLTLMFCIKENAMQVFKFLYHKYCTWYGIHCVGEDILSAAKELEKSEEAEEWLDSCDWLKLPTVPREFRYTNYGIDTGSECLLIEAMEVNNLQATVYLILKTALPISNKFITSLFKNYKIGWHCERGVHFLLNKATDLCGIVENGRNLLHVAAQHGWFCLARCLIEHYRFDGNQVNAQENGWDAFFYCVVEVGSKYGSQKILTSMMEKYAVDCFDKKDAFGRNVFYYAVKNNRLIAGYILKQKCLQLGSHSLEKRSTMLLSLVQEAGLTDAEILLCSQILTKLLPNGICNDTFNSTGGSEKPSD